jgi:hypothetical protein
MGILRLAANRVEATTAVFESYGHLQIVYEGAGVAQEIEVQAPYNADYFFEEGAYFAYPSVRPHLDPDNTTGTDNPPNTYKIVTLDTGDRDPGKVWELLESIHEQFRAASPNYLYGLGQNSNSYAATLLWMVGIDVSAYLAQVTPLFVRDGFPGVSRNILTNGYSATGSLDFDLTLVATDADDFLRSGTGNDTLSGAEGNDEIYSGSGEDTLIGGIGDDLLFGQDDNDTLIGGNGSDLLDGGDGYDTADYSAAADPDTTGRTAGVSVTQNASSGTGIVNDGLGGTDTLVSIEFVNGTSFDDSFAVTGSLVGIGGNSQLQFDGGANGDNGDTLNLSGVTSGGLTVVLETTGDAGYATHSSGFTGFFSDDAEIAFGGIENIVGSNQDDTITGNGGTNILYGGEGADTLSGGAEDDILIFDGDDTLVDGGAGRDVGIVSGEAEVTVDLAATGLEVVVGGAGNDNFTLNGQGDTLQMAAGGKGADIFTVRRHIKWDIRAV